MDQMSAHAKAELDLSDDEMMCDDNEDTGDKFPDAFAMDSKQFKKYKTITLLQEYGLLGIPCLLWSPQLMPQVVWDLLSVQVQLGFSYP
jgi:hypothetical protein